MQAKGKIGHIGLTNTDAAHLEMLCNSGFRIATNQVPVNVIDRRVMNGRLGEVCKKHNVGILAYASLLGGFLSEKWLGQPEPTDPESLNWSLRKYLRFIWEAGGWDKFQVVLQALATIASRHQVPIAAVATRWVLDVPAVKAVIVGSRLDDKTQEYASKNLLAFTFHLTDEDRALISEAQRGLSDVPGDCGDEYRRPPFLTVTGDLSHHLSDPQQSAAIAAAISKGQRIEYLTGSKWEPIAVSHQLIILHQVLCAAFGLTDSKFRRATAGLSAWETRSISVEPLPTRQSLNCPILVVILLAVKRYGCLIS